MIPGKLNLKLVEYLIFYYTERPHKALGLNGRKDIII